MILVDSDIDKYTFAQKPPKICKYIPLFKIKIKRDYIAMNDILNIRLNHIEEYDTNCMITQLNIAN